MPRKSPLKKIKFANGKRSGFSDNPPYKGDTGQGQGDAERVIAATTPKGNGNPNPTPQVSAESVMLALRSRFNPLRGLTPQLLSTYLDQKDLGYVAYAALVWDKMEQRDDVIRNVASKRKAAVSKLVRESMKIEDSKEAESHAEALDYFYDHLTAINALDQNESGALPLLIKQMMDAVGKYYAVHEVIWMDGEDGLKAQFRFVPLWFFENRSGRLQFLEIPLGGANGLPLDPGGWMITKGDGIMEACSIAYMFKNMPLKDWVSYNDKYGTPGVLGETDAAAGSPAAIGLNTAVAQFGQNWSGVITGSSGVIKEPIRLITARGEGTLPFPPLVERMDRALASLWRGSDLSTLSADNHGASIQGDESNILLESDAAMITETLNQQIDRWVIWQVFHTEPKAYSQIVVPKVVNIEKEMLTLRTLLESGAQIGMNAMMDRYGFPKLRADDTPLNNPAEIIQRITDAETGVVDPTEPKGVKTSQQRMPVPPKPGTKTGMPQKKYANAVAIVNALLEGENVPPGTIGWIEDRMKAILTPPEGSNVANEIALSIKSLPNWANEVYPENRAAAHALSIAVVNILLDHE